MKCRKKGLLNILEQSRICHVSLTLEVPKDSGAFADCSRILPVGAEVFETVRWAGRFEEVLYPTPVVLLPRMAVKMALCHSARANDASIRQALLDRFGGKDATGTKKSPGPLYGIHADLWSALAIAVTFAETRP